MRPCILAMSLSLVFSTVSLGSAPAIVELRVETGLRELDGKRSGTQVLVTARDAEGRDWDVTDHAALSCDPPGGLLVDPVGWATPGREVESKLVAKVGSLTASAPILVKNLGVDRAVGFRYEVLPALTRAGCNSGGCHGTPTGKNGFRLSLRGYLPDQDLQILTREFDGRRIDRLDPDASLILLKGSGAVLHQGGQRFTSENYGYRTIRDWIAQGARPDPADAPKLERIEVLPSYRIVDAPANQQRLMVRAYFAGGLVRDVTPLAKFSASDEAIARVDSSGLVKRAKGGEATILVNFDSLMATAQVVFRDEVPKGYAWVDPPASNFIDRHLNAKWKLLRIPPSDPADDATFARRIYFDAIGLPPSVDELKAFLADRRPDRRSKLVDSLIGSPEYVDHWTLKWADRLGCNQRFTGFKGAYSYHRWIRDQVAANVPFDRFVRAIVTARGANYTNPPASFYRRIRSPEDAAESVSQLFLGVRIQCAKCHNHVAERWTQDDYYGLAAFFGQVRYKNGPQFFELYNKEETVYLKSDAQIRQPRTGKVIAAKALGAPTPDLTGVNDRREALADWLTAPENPFFAKAAVNRIWFHLFGKGIVDPVDDLRESNPPASAELLQALADDFVAHGYDTQHTVRLILNSRTYGLSSETKPGNADDTRYFSHAGVRLQPAERLLDAISKITERPEPLFHLPNGTRAAQVPDGEFVHPFLKSFGQPSRSEACECERESDSTLDQALQLIAGRTVHRKVQDPKNRIGRLIDSGADDRAIVDDLFLACLSRLPDESERGIALAGRDGVTKEERRKGFEDLLWSLFNHPEFLFQH